jgi:hypothetical protein
VRAHRALDRERPLDGAGWVLEHREDVVAASSSVDPSISDSRNVMFPVGSFRCAWSCELMNPIGMIPCFFAARSNRLRARSRAASSSNATCPKRASALRTCEAS